MSIAPKETVNRAAVAVRASKEKICAASDGCDAAVKEWHAATAILSGTISVNGFGVHHDRYELRYKLLAAQTHIQEALGLLDGIDWPNNADYDVV